jgi:hypothetical protein
MRQTDKYHLLKRKITTYKLAKLSQEHMDIWGYTRKTRVMNFLNTSDQEMMQLSHLDYIKEGTPKTGVSHHPSSDHPVHALWINRPQTPN